MVLCEICGKETCNKRFCSNKCKNKTSWNVGLTKDQMPKSMYSKERNNKITQANILTWKNPEIREKRIKGLLEDYQENDQSERNQKISIGEKKSFLDPIKRENHLKHIKARTGDIEFSKKVSNWINNAIRNKGFVPENNAYTIGKYNNELGHIIRSAWEYEVCKFLVLNNIKYIYEAKKFDLEDCFFTPDIYFPDYNFYIEITGVLRPRKEYKLDKMKKLYSTIIFYNIGLNGKCFLLNELQQILSKKEVM